MVKCGKRTIQIEVYKSGKGIDAIDQEVFDDTADAEDFVQKYARKGGDIMFEVQTIDDEGSSDESWAFWNTPKMRTEFYKVMRNYCERHRR